MCVCTCTCVRVYVHWCFTGKSSSPSNHVRWEVPVWGLKWPLGDRPQRVVLLPLIEYRASHPGSLFRHGLSGVAWGLWMLFSFLIFQSLKDSLDGGRSPWTTRCREQNSNPRDLCRRMETSILPKSLNVGTSC